MDIISSLLVGSVQALCHSMNMTERRGGHKTDLKQAIIDLETATSELKAIRNDLKKRILKEKQDGRCCTERANLWLADVQRAEEKTESIKARCMRWEQRKRIHRRYLSCFGCADYKLSKKVLGELKSVNELIQRSKGIETDGGSSQETCRKIPTNPVVGITKMKERVLEFLSGEERGIIGIYGPGGVGKTTLMQSINNELISKGHQDDVLMIWVTMSRHFGECTIQKAVGARLGLTWGENDTGEDRAFKIYNELKQKQFLLFLDDVWEEISFEKTGIPPPDKENKCKVMFTTRSKALCSKMGAECNLRVEFLEKQYAWELFCDKVGRRDLLESPLIRPHAETIVSKCGGLPLALTTLGRAMANRETEEEWIHASEVLNKVPAEMKGMDYVFALLKYSYDNLESDLHQVCFLYCALFPEEHSIEIEQLVAYWLGEGFLISSHGINMLYKGYFLIGDLKAACLLETGDETTQVKMHNVVRSFALWMASEQANKEPILVEPRMGLTEAPQTENWRRAVVISLMDNRIRTLPEEPVCRNLTTLMLQQNSYLRRIPTNFFMYMPVLRVLDLSFTKITEIPLSIKYLVELHHLALSKTKIRVLPQELGNLKKLKHLDLHRNQFLQTIPTNSICRLSKLEVLNLYYSYVGWELKSLGEDAAQKLGFADLEHLENLTTLGITVRSLGTLKTLYEFEALHKCIQQLHVDKCNGLLYFDLSSLSNHGRNLRRLSITNCHDLEFMVRPTDVDWLPSLEALTLRSLHKLSRVWRNPVNQECLRNIRCINISQCHKLKNVSWVPQLPKLDTIVLSDCRELEELISDQESQSTEDTVLFPGLKNLSTRDLPKLSSILPSRFSFQKLETLVILNCPKVTKLPFQERVQPNLPAVHCEEKWWDALEKDPSNEELCYLPRFVSN